MKIYSIAVHETDKETHAPSYQAYRGWGRSRGVGRGLSDLGSSRTWRRVARRVTRGVITSGDGPCQDILT